MVCEIIDNALEPQRWEEFGLGSLFFPSIDPQSVYAKCDGGAIQIRSENGILFDYGLVVKTQLLNGSKKFRRCLPFLGKVSIHFQGGT